MWTVGDDELAQYREQGFLIVPELLTTAECAELEQALAPHVDGRYPGRNGFEGFRSERVYQLIAKHEAFRRLLVHDGVLSLLDRVLTPGYLISAFLAILVHPGETAQDLHWDDGFVHHPRPRPSNMVSVIWAIDEFTESNGATQFIPGSHTFDFFEAAAARDDPSLVETAVMPAGSALFMDGMLMHRGGANVGSTDRLAITPQYCEPWARQQENHILGTPLELTETLPARVRELMGHSIHPPFMGHVGGRHPDKRLAELLRKEGSG